MPTRRSSLAHSLSSFDLGPRWAEILVRFKVSAAWATSWSPVSVSAAAIGRLAKDLAAGFLSKTLVARCKWSPKACRPHEARFVAREILTSKPRSSIRSTRCSTKTKPPGMRSKNSCGEIKNRSAIKRASLLAQRSDRFRIQVVFGRLDANM